MPTVVEPFKYFVYDIKDDSSFEFETKKDCLCWLASSMKETKKFEQKIAHHVNDGKRFFEEESKNENSLLIKYNAQKHIPRFIFIEYNTVTEKETVLNKKYLLKEVKKITSKDIENYWKSYYAKKNTRWKAINDNLEKKDALKERLMSDQYKRNYFRSFRTIQEARANANPEHKPFVRGKRTPRNLPNSWSDCLLSRVGSLGWKDNTKCRKPWEKNLKRESDVVKDKDTIREVVSEEEDCDVAMHF